MGEGGTELNNAMSGVKINLYRRDDGDFMDAEAGSVMDQVLRSDKTYTLVEGNAVPAAKAKRRRKSSPAIVEGAAR